MLLWISTWQQGKRQVMSLSESQVRRLAWSDRAQSLQGIKGERERGGARGCLPWEDLGQEAFDCLWH